MLSITHGHRVNHWCLGSPYMNLSCPGQWKSNQADRSNQSFIFADLEKLYIQQVLSENLTKLDLLGKV